MSYSHEQRKKNIKRFKKDLNPELFYILVNGVKKTFKQINGKWKLVNYVEPMTSASK